MPVLNFYSKFLSTCFLSKYFIIHMFNVILCFLWKEENSGEADYSELAP